MHTELRPEITNTQSLLLQGLLLLNLKNISLLDDNSPSKCARNSFRHDNSFLYTRLFPVQWQFAEICGFPEFEEFLRHWVLEKVRIWSIIYNLAMEFCCCSRGTYRESCNGQGVETCDELTSKLLILWPCILINCKKVPKTNKQPKLEICSLKNSTKFSGYSQLSTNSSNCQQQQQQLPFKISVNLNPPGTLKMWAPETFLVQEIYWRYHLYQGRDKLWCTQKKK